VPDHILTTVEDITERKRLEQDHARLLVLERGARAETEAMNSRLRALLALTDTALSHLLLDDLLRELLGRVTDVMGVDHVAIFMLDEDGQKLILRAARGPAEVEIGRMHLRVGHGLAGHVAASREPMIVNDTSHSKLVAPLARKHLRSIVCVPLLVPGHVDGHAESRLVGALHVGSAAPRTFTEADVQLLQRAADRIALAISHVLLYAAEQDAHRRAETALSRAVVSETQATERAERLHTILETMNDGVAVYDTEGRPVQMNRAYREQLALDRAPVGYNALPILDRARFLHICDAAKGAPLPFEQTPLGRALRGEVVTGSVEDLLLRALDGRELEVIVSAAPLREQKPDGRLMGAVLLVRDITQRKQLEREREAAHADELAAREASQRLETFLATAAHDLRAPLGTTVGYLDLAQRKTDRLAQAVPEGNSELAGQVAAVRARLDEADHSAARLSRLLNVLFDTAAIRAGKLELHRAPCDLQALVREQVEAVRVAAPDRTIQLWSPAEGAGGGPILLEADADRIAEAVTNFLTNALKYSLPDRPVDISVEVRRGCARVAVRDQGPGIPKEERARVWELFYRAPGPVAQATTSSPVQGSSLGLGLYTCKAIVEAHGGRVGVKSAVGRGSTFWFTLPLSPNMA
jgi:signal transduction histidine kinase/putative methionine-R-sulfoxide reductase with GAF domain